MNALTLKNSQTDMRIVALSPEGNIRPVAMATEHATHQCLCDGDIIIYKTKKTSKMQYSIHGKSKKLSASDVVVSEDLLDEISSFLNGKEDLLPTGLGWNGSDTIQSVAFELGLDIFLTGLTSVAVLGGLMNLDSSLAKPKVGSFDVKQLFKLMNSYMVNSANKVQIDRMLSSVDINYREWLLKTGVCMHDNSQSWRHAKSLPDTLSVSCIIDDNGKPMRFNDLVVWRDLEEEPEVISVFDIVTTFNMNTNFITLPYVIGEDVKRIMYVLHDDSLSEDGNNVIWLYKKR